MTIDPIDLDDTPCSDACVIINPKRDPRREPTVEMKFDETAEMLRRAADLKSRISICGKYSDAQTLAWLIQKVAGIHP